MAYWLLKSEGSCYSIDDLARDKRTAWTGIRNFQARNYMRDGMNVGDQAFFYHSSGTPRDPSGIYGIAQIVGMAHIDETALDPKDEHYDAEMAKAYKEINQGPVPRSPELAKGIVGWVAVDIDFVKKFDTPILLADLKRDAALSQMLVLQRGQRLSVMPVTEEEWGRVLEIKK
ncbi:MAG: RNA-binding protein [Parcubacteria bacterium C7867-002]|nr:MAG: RNA-binding protein [Parcubacteria bacterium C7867-002]